MEARNPFRLRTAEQIVDDATFLKLFGPAVLDLLPNNDDWNKLQIFQSSPGGGKTTLFKLLTPNPLLYLHTSRHSDDQLKDLFKRLKGLNIISDRGPEILGVLISCVRTFSSLDDLDINDTEKDHLFFALVNARIILATLRAALSIRGLRYPENLDKLLIYPPAVGNVPPQLPLPSDGKRLFEWTGNVEASVCEAIDSFIPRGNLKSVGHQNLFALSILEPGCIKLNGKPVAKRSILMLDDAHKLTQNQRGKLFEAVSEYRANVGVWISQRLEALTPPQLIRGANIGREYTEPIDLENFWRQKPSKFEKLVLDIADRRALSARDVKISSFAGQLMDSLDGREWIDHYEEAVDIISERLRVQTAATNQFESWMDSAEKYTGNSKEKAIFWRTLEIKVRRKIRDSQKTLEVGIPLSEKELVDPTLASLKNAAEKFIAEEFKLPYFFGHKILAAMALPNIDQFVAFAGDLFEDIVSTHLLRKSTILNPITQERILRKATKAKWNEIRRKVSNAKDVQQFLLAIGTLCRQEWEKGTASYGSGGAPSGIGITTEELEGIINPPNYENQKRYNRLLATLSACLANNWLNAYPDRQQGGKTWMVLYLNRWLCVYFDLPIHYGGWRSKRVNDLEKWVRLGFNLTKS